MGAMLQASGVPETLRVRELLTEFRGYYPAPLPMAQVIERGGPVTGLRTACSASCPAASSDACYSASPWLATPIC